MNLTFQNLGSLKSHLEKESAIQDLKKELSPYLKNEVTVKGFLYPLNENFVLSSEPHLKSCCVGTAQNISKQIIVFTNLKDVSKDRVVTLKGHFNVDPQWDEKGSLIQLYTLKDAVLIESHAFSATSLIFFLILITSFFLFWRLLKSQKAHE